MSSRQTDTSNHQRIIRRKLNYIPFPYLPYYKNIMNYHDRTITRFYQNLTPSPRTRVLIENCKRPVLAVGVCTSSASRRFSLRRGSSTIAVEDLPNHCNLRSYLYFYISTVLHHSLDKHSMGLPIGRSLYFVWKSSLWSSSNEESLSKLVCNISQQGPNPFDALKGVDKGRALRYRASTTDVSGKRSYPAELYLQLIHGTLTQTILIDGGHLNCGAAKSLTHT